MKMNVKKALILAAAAVLLVLSITAAASAAITLAPEESYLGSEDVYGVFAMILTDKDLKSYDTDGQNCLPYIDASADAALLSGLSNPDGYGGGLVMAAWGPYQHDVSDEAADSPALKAVTQQYTMPEFKYLEIDAGDEIGEAVQKFQDDAFVYFACQSGDEYIQIAKAKLNDILSEDANDEQPPYLVIPEAVTSAYWDLGVYDSSAGMPEVTAASGAGTAGVRIFLVKGTDKISEGGSDGGGGSGDAGSGSGSSGGSGGCSAGMAGLALLAVPFVVRRQK